jgi:hypothetical protein
MAMGQQVIRVQPAPEPIEAPSAPKPARKRQIGTRKGRRALHAMRRRAELQQKNRGNKIAAVLAKGKHGHAIYG